jgi:hypothetical protein
MWSAPNSVLFEQSHGTLYITQYQDDNALLVIDAKSIVSVVAMVPMLPADSDSEETNSDQFFLVQRPGLESYELADVEEDDSDKEMEGDDLA